MQQDSYRGEVGEALSHNLTTYCNNNPLKYVDPSGHAAITKSEIKKIVCGTHLKSSYDKSEVLNRGYKIKVYLKGSMKILGANIEDGTVHLLSRNKNNKISKADLKTNYSYASSDVSLILKLYKQMCKGLYLTYNFEKYCKKEDFVNEHKMHLYKNFDMGTGYDDTVQTDMTYKGSFVFGKLLQAPTYNEFCKQLDASGRK